MRWQSVGALSVMTGMAMMGCGEITAPDIGEGIIGRWTWVESTGGIAGLTRTPASTGETRSLRFDGSFAESFRDGELQRRDGYSLNRIGGTEGFQIIYHGPLAPFASQAVELRADTLVLIDPCCDGFTSRYERSK